MIMLHPTRSTKNIRRRPIVSWMISLGVVAMGNTVWHSLAFSRHLTGELLFFEQLDFPQLAKKRRRRRPPSYTNTSSDLLTTMKKVKQLETSTPLHVLLSQESEAMVCHDLQYARILISGILMHSFGVELALYLSKVCGVQKLVGVSEHALDSPSLQRLAFLSRELPRMELLYQKTPSESGYFDEKMRDLVSSFKPTHVIHLEPTCFLPNSLQIQPDMTAVRNSINKLQRLCEAAAQQNPRLLYLTMTTTRTPYIQNSIKEIYPLVLTTYRSLYSVDTMRLELPSIYGPFEESLHLMETSSSFHNTDYIHITDSIYLTLTCLNKPTSKVRLPSYQASNAHFKTFTQVQNDPQMQSWYFKQSRPFETTNTSIAINQTNNLLATQQHNAGISQLERWQYQLFPCSSECATPGNCHEPSAWTPTLVSHIQNFTESCRFVVYTVDYSPHLEELPELKNATESNIGLPNDLLCQVAIVSPHSKIVNNDSSNSGMINHNGWQLFWPSSQNISHADFILPKIAPGTLFGQNVTKAMYFDYRRMDKLPSLPILYFLMAKQLDQKQVKGRTKLIKQKGTHIEVETYIPGIPARHMALFTHAHFYNYSSSSSIHDMAKFVLLQKGLSPESIDEKMPPQLQFYEMVGLDKVATLPDTFLMVHNLQSERSRRLRCEWYQEELFWQFTPGEIEELSFVYVLAKQRMEHRLVKDDDPLWGDRMISTAEVSNSNTTDKLPSKYFVKLHPAMKARRRYYKT